MHPIEPISLAEIQEARVRVAEAAIRTPLIPLDLDGHGPGAQRIWLKLECLQPIGSFKIRGAANAMALADAGALARGVYTGSAGNMAQGVAYNARRLGIPCRVVVPDSAPRAKLDAIRRLGAGAVSVPYDAWWRVLREHGHPGEQGLFIHPVSDRAVIAGNATVGLEIVEDLADVRSIVVPFGGGGLACGIASAVKAKRPDIRVYAAEVDTAAPFAASLEVGRPVEIDRTASFVDGIGGSGVLPEMWPLASTLLDGSLVESIEAVREAIRVLVREAHVVAEGAGAAALATAASASSDVLHDGPTVAVISGGNIDVDVLVDILQGRDGPES